MPEASGTSSPSPGRPPQTSAIASVVPPLANAASRAKRRRSSGWSRSRLHSKAARSVWWRGGAVRRPRVRSEKRSVSPSSTPMIGRSPSAAAASSIASGIPFSWATMRATSPAFSSVSSNCGLTERARSTNRRTASAAAASSAPSIVGVDDRRIAPDLALDVERLRAGGQDHQVRATPGQARGGVRHGVEEVLATVQHHKGDLVGQRLDQDLVDAPPRLLRDTRGLGNRPGDRRRVRMPPSSTSQAPSGSDPGRRRQPGWPAVSCRLPKPTTLTTPSSDSSEARALRSSVRPTKPARRNGRL